MTTAQKIIKYLAIAFAIFLIITIISTILTAIVALSGILGIRRAVQNSNTEMVTTSFESAEIHTLNIDIAATNLTIKQGEILKIETDNSNIDCKQNNEELKINEKDYKWFSYNNVEKQLILYIPEDLEFEKVKINVGVGKVTISSGTINDLDFDMGIGEANITANLVGKNEINAGVGELNIKLQGEKDSYKVKADKGIGSIKIDGKEISNGEVYGDGENQIDIDGGIGSINIKFEM
ncbi:MAG: DUF4097 family beta strand repeat protein [Clostridia bacterium]|nr:DUF4097 family beta strand repeat protein [Clostridia bacterium]